MMNYRWGAENPGFWKPLLPFMVLDLVLRGFALWRAAKKEQKWWYVIMLVVNSLGILPAVYLLTSRESEYSPLPKSKKTAKKK